MGMFSAETTTTHICPVCDASTSHTREQNMNSNGLGVKIGNCNVCGWERESKPTHTRNAIGLKYISVPKSSTPRKGIQILSENANISISTAADILNSDTETTFDDI